MLSQTQSKQHPSDEVVECYALGNLNGNQSANFEEHLIICEQCQARLTEADHYIVAIRDAAAAILREPCATEHKKGFWLMWAAASAAFALAMLLPWQANRVGPLHEVELVVARGAASQSVATASRGERLALNLDLTEVSSAPAYRLELVNGAGESAWSGVIKPQRNRIRVEPNVKLPAGLYWVDLYLPSKPPSLLREYGLEVR